MKKYSIYLHQEVIDTLECFGNNISEVVNKLFEDCINTGILYDNDIPPAPDREGARRVEIFLNYDVICQLSGIRVRPVIYWFIENEIYSELGWEMRGDYGVSQKLKLKKQFDRAISELRKLDEMYGGKITDIVDTLEGLRYSV